MIYLIRDRDFIACETAARAADYVAQGYERCSHAAFTAAWARRDRATMRAIGLVEQDRTAGQPLTYYGMPRDRWHT